MDFKKKLSSVRKPFSNGMNKIPNSPGVYIMKDAGGKIIYIGKAKSLRKRVRSYFRGKANLSLKQSSLITNVKDIDYISTTTETQALFLEASLIKKNIPKYNVSLKDDKSYPLIKITKEEFPAIFVCRPKARSDAHFFGPYSNATLLRETLRVIRRAFPYRTCRIMPKSACLNLSLGLCSGPCIGLISKKKYLQNIRNIDLILQGEQEYLLRQLTEKMQEKAKKLDFEEASKIRDQIQALSSLYKDKTIPTRDYLKEAEQLKDVLNLSVVPEKIEAFDVSNIFGKEAVGCLVSFYQGRPDKNNYRRFKIKDIEGIDDYRMLAEIVRRRYNRLKENNLSLPDLIIIDGGKGQLSSTKRELDKLDLDISIISIAKREEEIFLGNRKRPIILPFNSAALQLVRRIRDEAHRFALAYHHILRRKVAFEGK